MTDGAPTTTDLEKSFKEYSVAEFFKKNRQMLGYAGETRSLTTIVHEYVTNSLDSCEDAKVLPDILVEVHSLTARPRKTVLGIADGSEKNFDLTDSMGKAALFEVFVNDVKKERGTDYVVKYGRKGKQSVKQVVFRSSPSADAEVSALWATGHLKVVVQDNGTGIPKSKVGAALGKLLAGTKFQQQKQKRGQQGIGAAYATLFAQITTGKPTFVRTGSGNGSCFECEVSVDVKKNESVLSNQKEVRCNFTGLRVEAEFSEVAYERSEYGVYEYLRRTALANPHAQITLIEPDKNLVVFPRASTKFPEKAESIKPHPLGLGTSDLMDMAAVTQARKVGSFLSSDFSRISNDKVKEVQEWIGRKTAGDPKSAFLVDFEKHPRNLTWEEAERIVNAFHHVKFNNPDLTTIQPIGEDQIEKSLKNLLKPEFLSVVERKPKVFRGGIPFMVECAVAYGGNSGSGGNEGEFLRFANRVPLLFDAGSCAITEAMKTVDWNRYGLKDFQENQPVTVFVNFVSVYVPYTGAGKLAIAAEDEIVAEIRMGLMDAARSVGSYLSGIKKAEDREKRKLIFFKYIPEVAEALHDVTGKPKAALESSLKKIAETRTVGLEEEDADAEKALEAVEEAEEKEIEEES
ncbi:MAG: DNA topoisomerase VI subunit B [Candidatus Micrarchaeia archaeon]